ncbi:MAG: 2-oxoacid:acceptor oxidoreductase subunit alpha [Deltaproteobacteria bacterium]|nr:MAG: 2-oxoacid:acceptor oxidoreductase subunit alpha [Deltaproteobacteria bacterium]
MPHIDFAVGIGGAAGQGVATPGNILAKLFARRGLHINAYNAYQSIIRGGHTFLTIRTSEQPVRCMGDDLAMLIPLNQDTMDRHLGLMRAGASVLYDRDRVKPGAAAEGVQLCPLPLSELAKNVLYYNTAAVAAVLRLVSVELKPFEDMLAQQFKRKGDAVVAENVTAARAGYDYAGTHFKPYAFSLPDTGKRLAVATGNESLAMGGVAAGVKFYCAYPMSPSTGVLMWMARHARELGIMVRQVEDELGVINMAIGAAHTGCRAMCATSGGGFALMTEALGAAAMMEIPVVCINVQRAGPATGVPTKTEQGDLWQVLGAGQGDYPRIIAAPTSIRDCFHLIPEIFNLADKFQCPGIVLADLLESEGFSTFEPAELDFNPPRDRGEIIGLGGEAPEVNGGYKRYRMTESGISPRAVPGTPDHAHVVATDEHDEDGVLISDEFTDPRKRQAIMERRGRKMDGVLPLLEPPRFTGPADAEVTLVGWGSTEGVIDEAVEQLAAHGIVANHLQIRWLVPLQSEAIGRALSGARNIVVVENNYSGQFARYLRSETGIAADAHIRKYDGEPFMPHHVVNGVEKILAGKTTRYVPVHEIRV